ncbi:MAG: heavy metal-binding domain-containing protein, partial [Ferruginibacter sp.]
MKKILIIILVAWQGSAFAQHDMNNMPGMKMPMAKKEVKKVVAKKTTAKSTATKVIYTCPMHPQVQKTKPGSCPICGMTLVKKTIKVTTTKPASQKHDMPMPIDTMPGHDMNKMNMEMPIKKDTAVNHDNMEGMEMPPQPSGVGNKINEQPVTYTCPMHPEIHSSKPGNCPKCGMRLVKEKPKASQIHQMDMQQSQPTTFTCPMHQEIHSSKPGNCPKCGMKLVKEKPKAISNPAMMNHDNMQMTKDKPMDKQLDMGNMNMSHQNMDKMDNMNMSGMSDQSGATELAKTNLGPLKYITSSLKPRTVRYDLYIRDTIVTYGKKPKRAIAVNGQIPMPTLTFTEGDTAEIYVHNELNEVTSLHWHGLFLPNKMDGVPFLTQMPIKPGATYLYKYPIIQHGTHWYHSHSGLQEQIGMYGTFIMNKRKEWDIPTIPIVLSEWTDMKPEEVHRSLRSATDWFAIKKGTTQSYAEAIRTGHLKTKLTNEWKRMNAMDVSDVYYDNFLINGKNQNEQPQFKAGDKVRLRIANGGASDYFWLTYSGGKITVVATDGNDVEPVEVDRLIIAVSETYDLIVTIPENKSYEFLVTPEDRTKSASLWLGKGERVPATRLPKLKYFAGMKMMNDMMDMNGNMIEMEGMQMANQIMDMNTVMYPEITGPEKPGDEMNMNDMKNMQPDKMKKDSMPQGQNIQDMKLDKMQGMEMNKPKQNNMHGHNMQMPDTNSMAGMNMGDDNSDIVTLNYTMLKAAEKTTLPEGPWHDLKFDLTGNMNRYVWSLDNKVVSETDKILIKKGERLRIVLFNNSMMRHPMHLHGHDFRLLNGQGEFAPMKNIIDIMPMEKDTIEFYAGEAGGDWFFHCHILYHMMSGMGRVLSYDNTLIDKTDITDPKVAKRGLNSDDRKFHPMGRIGLETNGSDGEFMFAQTRWKASTLWHLGYHSDHGYESET